MGPAAEAGLLHFRGAFQDPFMYVPVTVPPLAALALGATALRPDGAPQGVARSLLWASAAAGFIGMGFHAWGIHRNMGGCRMGTDPEESVTNADGRTWEIPNLWICDGSLMPTGGGVNPSGTIMALACRIGDRIAEMGRGGEL